MDATGALFVLGIVLVALLPSLYYLVRTRNSERYAREPYVRLLAVFGYGAISAVVVSLVLEIVIIGNLSQFERLYMLGDTNFLGAVVVAPIVEEAAKALGVVFVVGYFARAEDGLVYGVAAGLGFAATENLLYEVTALDVGVIAYFATALIRTISSTLLHASATGVTGLGLGRAHAGKRPLALAFPYYLVAVLMHSFFNLVAGLGTTHPTLLGDYTDIASLVICVVFAGVAFRLTRERLAS
jgi:RsiW-degrading membrane proteinase PrsW (M82 family)